MENNKVYQLTKRDRNRWSGISTFNNTSSGFSIGFSASKRQLNTGLTPERQKYFEEKLKLEDNALSPYIKPDGEFISQFWKDFNILVTEKGITLNTSNPMDELCIEVLQASKLVTKRGQPSSSAIYELHNMEDSAKFSNITRQEKTKAFKYYGEMSISEKIDYCISKGKNVETAGNETIDNLVGIDVESNPLAFNLWVNNDSYKRRVELYRFVHLGIIRKAGSSFYYEDVKLGFNEDTAISFLGNITNQKIKEGILQQYQSSKTTSSINLLSELDTNESQMNKEKENEKENEKEQLDTKNKTFNKK